MMQLIIYTMMCRAGAAAVMISLPVIFLPYARAAVACAVQVFSSAGTDGGWCWCMFRCFADDRAFRKVTAFSCVSVPVGVGLPMVQGGERALFPVRGAFLVQQPGRGRRSSFRGAALPHDLPAGRVPGFARW